MKYEFITNSAQETKEVGQILAAFLGESDVILLEGDLGAGKTTLTKGIAEGLKIDEKVNSPTFNIMKIYLNGRVPLFHIDAYRLKDNEDDIGLDEYIGNEGISVIEWPHYIAKLLPNEYLSITITHLDLEKRKIVIETKGRYEKTLTELTKHL